MHEAFIRLITQEDASWEDRAHFFRTAARAMRQVLIDHARGRNAAKRGGGWQRHHRSISPTPRPVQTPLDFLALDESLERLAQIDERQATVVEMRFFAGMGVEDVAGALGVSPRTVELDWKMARAWLSRELAKETEH